MSVYYRPDVCFGPNRPQGAATLAGGAMWFTHAWRMGRGRAPQRVSIEAVPTDVLDRLTAPRRPIAGLDLAQPQLMGILNVTPDSFSDGGLFNSRDAALAQARALIAGGADILDIGGESTRPGAQVVPVEEEIARTAPVISAVAAECDAPISIDTRKAPVAQAAWQAGATLINDVSALTFDPDMAEVARNSGLPLCLMHALGTPDTMQDAPRYGDVLFDVYDALAAHVARAEAFGLARDRLIVDPGIGFGKTLEHNLTLLGGLSLFHGLGCAVLLGASRKRFIGTLGGGVAAPDRAAGSVGVALAAVAQGVQMLRVHDIAETKQALTLWWAATKGSEA